MENFMPLSYQQMLGNPGNTQTQLTNYIERMTEEQQQQLLIQIKNMFAMEQAKKLKNYDVSASLTMEEIVAETKAMRKERKTKEQKVAYV